MIFKWNILTRTPILHLTPFCNDFFYLTWWKVGEINISVHLSIKLITCQMVNHFDWCCHGNLCYCTCSLQMDKIDISVYLSIKLITCQVVKYLDWCCHGYLCFCTCSLQNGWNQHPIPVVSLVCLPTSTEFSFCQYVL